MAMPTVEEMEAYAREVAAARGMDPDKFVRALRTEGLARDTWQSRVTKNGMREPSFGPMQLLVGDGKNFPKGLGNKMIEDTGVDPSDPANWKAAMDYGADTVAREGWRQWYGPKNAGLPTNYGLTKNTRPLGLTLTSNSVASPQDAIDAAPYRKPVVDAPMVANNSPVTTTPTKELTLGERIGNSLFGEKLAGQLRDASAPAVPGTATTPASPGGTLTQGLSLFSNIFKPPAPQQQQAEVPIQSALPALAAEDAARAQGASQLMATIMADRKKRQGLTLNTMGMV